MRKPGLPSGPKVVSGYEDVCFCFVRGLTLKPLL